MLNNFIITQRVLTLDSISLIIELAYNNSLIHGEIVYEENLSLNELEEQCYPLLDKLFTEDRLRDLSLKISTEITDAAYEGDYTVEDTVNLNDDLKLTHFSFYEDAIILTYVAPLIFNEHIIDVQLNHEYIIEDVMINM